MAVAPQPSSSTMLMEICVVSAEGLNTYSSYLYPKIRPFITITKHHPPTPAHVIHDPGCGLGPTSAWEHKLRVAVDPAFFSDRYSCLHLQLFTKRRIVGPAQLGWCVIPASDIGLIPSGGVRFLSYRLRATDGSRGHVIINISIRLEGHHANAPVTVPWTAPPVDACRTVIGIPVTAIRGTANGNCNGTNANTAIIR